MNIRGKIYFLLAIIVVVKATNEDEPNHHHTSESINAIIEQLLRADNDDDSRILSEELLTQLTNSKKTLQTTTTIGTTIGTTMAPVVSTPVSVGEPIPGTITGSGLASLPGLVAPHPGVPPLPSSVPLPGLGSDMQFFNGLTHFPHYDPNFGYGFPINFNNRRPDTNQLIRSPPSGQLAPVIIYQTPYGWQPYPFQNYQQSGSVVRAFY